MSYPINPNQMQIPGVIPNAPGSSPALGQGQDPNFLFKEQLAAVSTIMEQLQKSVRVTVQDLEKLTKGYNQATGAAAGLSKESASHTANLKEQQRLLKETAKDTQARLESEKRLSKIFKDNKVVNQQALQNELRHSKLAKPGQYYIPPHASGGKVVPGSFVSSSQFAAAMNDPNISAAVKDQLSRKYQAEQLSGNQNRFRIKEFAHAAMSGDIGGAVGELMQSTRLSGKFGGGIERAANSGLAGRLGISGLLTRSIPFAEFLGTPGALIAGQQLYTRGMRQFNESRQMGYETGDSASAGFASRANAFGQALNPFDMLSFGDAQKIRMNLAQAGFRGNQREGAAGIIGDMKNQGIAIDTASKLVISSLRDAGMTMDQTRLQMLSLRDSAKSAGSSLTDMTTAVTNAITELSTKSTAAAQGAQPAIGILGRQFARTGPGQVQVQPGTIASMLSGTQRTTLGQLLGLAPWQVWSKAFSNPEVIAKSLDRVLIGIAKNKPSDMDMQGYVAFFMMSPLYQQLFGSTPYPQIAAMLNRVWAGTKQGTDVQGFERRTAINAMNSSFKGITAFSNRGVHKGVGGFLYNALAPNAYEHNTIGNAEVQKRGASILANLRQAAMGAGISYDDRKAAFAPLVQAIAGGHMGEIRKATQVAEQQLKADAANHPYDQQTVKVVVGFQGEANNYLREHRRSVQSGKQSGSRNE